ncbi:selenocysteine lyase isoform X5 [Muntiacus reevesi]|uniref:selenocysteine lyase isoform X5 n=1 Tax=Muntiacus reevesi TaxID=9886 RepID=UPI0033077C77
MEAAGARSRDARGRAEKSPPESRKVYMDYNATTPLEPEVIEAMTEAMREAWGNPSSSYPAGRKAKEIINTARENLAKMIGGQPQDVIFTSGGTESNNLVIQSVVKHFHKVHAANGDTGGRPSPVDGALPHIITCTVEHDSIRLPLEHLGEEHVAEVTFVPVSKVNGQVEAEDILAAIRPATCLVTIMLANNETGVVMPVPEISRRVRALNQQRAAGGLPGVLVHTDAAQALGKRRVDVRDLGVDFLTIVGHKFYGPRIGALYVRGLGEQTPLYPMLFGGGQERNFRPGTENTPMIAGLGKRPPEVRHGRLFLRPVRLSLEWAGRASSHRLRTPQCLGHQKPDSCQMPANKRKAGSRHAACVREVPGKQQSEETLPLPSGSSTSNSVCTPHPILP